MYCLFRVALNTDCVMIDLFIYKVNISISRINNIYNTLYHVLIWSRNALPFKGAQAAIPNKCLLIRKYCNVPEEDHSSYVNVQCIS